jgi:hypothetical protein
VGTPSSGCTAVEVGDKYTVNFFHARGRIVLHEAATAAALIDHVVSTIVHDVHVCCTIAIDIEQQDILSSVDSGTSISGGRGKIFEDRIGGTVWVRAAYCSAQPIDEVTCSSR